MVRPVWIAAVALSMLSCGDDDGAPPIGFDADPATVIDGGGETADAGPPDAGVSMGPVACGAATCTAPAEECCSSAGVPFCVDRATCAGEASWTCDGPEDCGPGQSCCFSSGGFSAVCTDPAECEITVCHTADDCGEPEPECCPISPAFPPLCATACF